MTGLKKMAVICLCCISWASLAQVRKPVGDPGIPTSGHTTPAGTEQQANGAALPINQTDKDGLRTGLWWERHPAVRGEVPFTAFGTYNQGLKLGPWYRMDELGDLVAIENYRFNVLHGEVKYFEQGHLACVGHYLGLNPSQAYDTVLVLNPVTREEKLVPVKTDRGALRHGLWRYYDPNTGRLIREEDYQADELLSRKDFETSTQDSAYYQLRENNMPHNQPAHYRPPKNKTGSLTEWKSR